MIKELTLKTDDNIEIYTNGIYQLCDDYISTNYPIDVDKKDINFRHMLLSVFSLLQYDNKDIYILDNLFTCYVNLCAIYNKNPTVEFFRILVGLSSSTFHAWVNGTSRKATPEYLNTCKKWLDICKSNIVDDLSNSDKTSVNKIYITKALYGMAETTPTNNPTTPGRYIDADTLPTLSLTDGQTENIIELSEN